MAPLAPARPDRKILRMFVVPGFGLLGAWLDLYAGWTILTAIGKISSDYNDFASENPTAAWFLGQLFPDAYNNADQATQVFGTAALVLLGFGLLGALASLLFIFGRWVKPLAVLLLVCGIAPMLHHPLEFVGLPMSLAGLMGLFVRDKLQLNTNP